ncbi:hypothetical protein [Nocardiopsis sp. JB363]|uniref:hypothetical protein n=1 Tax=Nocardiopsis sp. JB363 TaxID=1434837 RepID=UPI00097A0E57|nr:hypothetical protein [Nocardiopsis sp. JB363]SIO85632.1 hypothetical protein BQ8420_07930 [Nocardiopsis sp. JB363]
MTYVTAALCTLVRLLRPCGGLHTDPSGYLRALAAEYRRRSRRVRRYTLPEHTSARPTATAQAPDQFDPFIPRPRRPVDLQHPIPLPASSRTMYSTPETPWALLPTFRVSHDHAHVLKTSAATARDDLVRTYYRVHEQHARTIRTRNGHTA